MRLIIADPTGLCFGVRRAIEQLESTLLSQRSVYCLGSPIHNPQEVTRLEKMGLLLVDGADQVPLGGVVFIRAHGVGPVELQVLQDRSALVVDGTCPFVRTAQQRAKTLSDEGYRVLILGDKNHPEVRGILGYIEGDALVLSSPDEITPEMRFPRCGVLSQTTQKEATLSRLVERLVSKTPELKVYNTICKATIERQESISRLASQVDGILVIGGRNSANTQKLVEIAEEASVPTLWVEHAGELDRGWLQNKGSIGVAAGGSTPDWLIKEITEKLLTL